MQSELRGRQGNSVLYDSLCVVCDAGFSYAKSGSGRRRYFCSETCKKARYKGRKYAVLPKRPCPTCSVTFTPRKSSRAKPEQLYCSLSCRPSPVPRVYACDASRKQASEHRRRARRRVLEVDRFDPIAVFERDNWICGICCLPVDPTEQFPSHMSVSLDHVVPLASGGAHSIENSQCSHWICNSRKGHRSSRG